MRGPLLPAFPSRRPASPTPRPIAATALLVLALAGMGCSTRPAPTLAALDRLEPKTPVVVVPGITGTMLRESATGKVVWGTGPRLIFPKDGGYGAARAIHTPITSRESRLAPDGVLDRIVLAGIFRQDVYRPMTRAFTANGYRLGDLEDPDPGDSVFFFPYDWRQDNIQAAQLLLEGLERLRAVRGEETLTVDLVCQSNGGHICRYLLKYGAATLEEAEGGAAPVPWLAARKVILMGSSGGGGLRILRELHRGRRYVALVGRQFRAETAFTFPGLYQDLPVYRPRPFLDENGGELPIDLFDAESWQRYGWSVFQPEIRRRLARKKRPDIFGDETQRLEFLRRMLDYAQRFHAVLHRDVEGFAPPPTYLLQSAYHQTPDRAVLLEEEGVWKLLFTGDKELRRRPYLEGLAAAAGDGHATLESQTWLSPQEVAAIAAPPFYVEDDHFELILDHGTLRRMLDYLAD